MGVEKWPTRILPCAGWSGPNGKDREIPFRIAFYAVGLRSAVKCIEVRYE